MNLSNKRGENIDRKPNSTNDAFIRTSGLIPRRRAAQEMYRFHYLVLNWSQIILTQGKRCIM
jgi:hypothetical protein